MLIEYNTTTTLGTALAGKKVIASNRGLFSATDLVLSTARSVIPTPSDAGNCTGFGVCFVAGAFSSTSLRDVKGALQQTKGTCTISIASPGVITNAGHGLSAGDIVMFSTTGALPTGLSINSQYFVIATGLTANTFQVSTTSGGSAVNTSGTQSGTHTLWVERASKTLTGTDICGSITLASNPVVSATAQYVVKFEFPSPYAVTAVANTWRLIAYQPGTGGTNNWSVKTSNGTAIFYEMFSDIAATFTSGDAVSVTAGTLTNDLATGSTIKGILGSGEVDRAIAVLLYRNTDPTIANVANFLWDGSTSRKLVVDGLITESAHSGFQAGTDASRISYANQGWLEFTTPPTVGTVSGIGDTEMRNTADDPRKTSLFIYGEVPAVESSYLYQQANIGDTTIYATTDVSSWQAGWKIALGYSNATGLGDGNLYTLNAAPTWDGTKSTIILTSAIASFSHLIGGDIQLQSGGYGFKITSSSTTAAIIELKYPSNLKVIGCEAAYLDCLYGRSTTYSTDEAANRSKYEIKHNAFTGTGEFMRMAGVIAIQSEGVEIDFNNLFSMNLCTIVTTPGVGTFYIRDNRIIRAGSSNPTLPSGTVFQRNRFSNGIRLFVNLTGINIVHQDNSYFGTSQSLDGALRLNSCINPISSGNSYNRNAIGVKLINANLGSSTNDKFGDIAANTVDIDPGSDTYTTFEFRSPTVPAGSLVINESNLINTSYGTDITITDSNDVENADLGYLTYGKRYRTGYGLSDTTVWTGTGFGVASAGQFGLKLEPNDGGFGTSLFVYQDNAPNTTVIGNCQNLPVSVAVRLKIKSANYYAGTYVLPRVRVTYDGSTEITAQATATTDPQVILVNFTPATTAKDIKIEIEAATSAIGTDAQFYVGEIVVIKPEGVFTDTTKMYEWSHGKPLGTSRTFPSPESTLDALMANHVVPGSAGEALSTAAAGGSSSGGLTEDQLLETLIAMQ